MISDRDEKMVLFDQDGAVPANPYLRVFKRDLSVLLQDLASTSRIPGVVAIPTKSDVIHYYLFVTGVYMDDSIHSTVVEAFVYEPTREQQAKRVQKSIQNQLHVKSYPVAEVEELDIWQRGIPAMVERCRDWEHRQQWTAFILENYAPAVKDARSNHRKSGANLDGTLLDALSRQSSPRRLLKK
jgi:hypothetical protein